MIIYKILESEKLMIKVLKETDRTNEAKPIRSKETEEENDTLGDVECVIKKNFTFTAVRV